MPTWQFRVPTASKGLLGINSLSPAGPAARERRQPGFQDANLNIEPRMELPPGPTQPSSHHPASPGTFSSLPEYWVPRARPPQAHTGLREQGEALWEDQPVLPGWRGSVADHQPRKQRSRGGAEATEASVPQGEMVPEHWGPAGVAGRSAGPAQPKVPGRRPPACS